ncbi:MAG: glycosyltransferase family 4 protein [Candidatus Zixiibacteriota bacterium]
MNILALNWNDLKNPLAGGAEVHLEELLRRLVINGHSVTLFCSSWAGCAPQESVEGVRIIRRGARSTFNLTAPFQLRQLVADNRFDVLVEDINKIPFYTPWYLDLPTLVVVPHLFATTVFQEINFVLGSYIYLAERPLVSAYKGRLFNVISESTADDLAVRGIPRDNISVVHCGIDRSIYSHDATVGKYDRPTVLYLGRIKKYKSIQHLIVAFARIRKKLPTARLMVVGAGDYLPKLQSLAASIELGDSVEFPGFVSQSDKVDRMRCSHVNVLPSIREGWGLTNIEANAVGTMVVAADSPGLRDSVRHDESGLLYPFGNVDRLTECLHRALTDEELRARLEKGGLAWAEQFSWDRAASQFEQVLEQTVKRGR